MTEHETSRTLVKSPPELWAECSDAASLARHLGEFGEIKITRLEPETSVAWEGERARGTVRIEPSAWGTRVTLTAQVVGEPAVAPPLPPEPVPEPAPAVAPPPPVAPAAPPRGLLARWRSRWRPAPLAPEPPREPPREPVAEPVAEPAAEPAAEPVRAAAPEPPASVAPALDAAAALAGALDSLGQAHHRPFSRA